MLGLGIFIIAGGVFIYFAATLPAPYELADRLAPASTKIYDRQGELLYEVQGEHKRTRIPFSQMPDSIKAATIALEDKNFYKHMGVDFTGIARAIKANFQSKSRRQGASTITQQFVRNAVLTRDKTIGRKLREIVLALELEMQYDKNQILELYLNEIPYGSNIYGIEAAAQTYFGKPAMDLTMAE